MMLVKIVQYVVAAALLSTAGYLLYPYMTSLLTPACSKPLQYSLASIDPRFGTTRAMVEEALVDAEALWEDAAGIDLFTLEDSGGISVRLVYSEEQQTNELGEVIDAEQEAYLVKKAELEKIKLDYNRARTHYERAAEIFDKRAAAYHAEVNRWNHEGGAPPGTYDELQQEQKDLEAAQESLQKKAEEVNNLAAALNEVVDGLNALAKKLNAKVDVYNERAGDAFDQGDYQEDQGGKRITVYEFSNGTDLRRVLAHEFGHALSIGHVESPDSIMYSFNAGDTLVLSDADIEELRQVCRLDS